MVHGLRRSIMVLCTSTSGTFATTGTPGSNSGYHCWCRANAFTPTGGSKQSINSTPWVYAEYYPVNYEGQNEDCYGYCASVCAEWLGRDDSPDYTAFRAAIYGQSN